MRYNQDKCLSFLHSEKKKSKSGRIPIYVGEKAQFKDALDNTKESKEKSSTPLKSMKNAKQIHESVIENRSLISTDDDHQDDGGYKQHQHTDKESAEQRFSEEKPASTASKNDENVVPELLTKGKGSLIPKYTRRFRRQGSKKRAAALVDELSKSVEDLSRLKIKPTENDENLESISILSKSCDTIDTFDDEGQPANITLKDRKSIFGTRKSSKRKKALIDEMENAKVVIKETQPTAKFHGKERKNAIEAQSKTNGNTAENKTLLQINIERPSELTLPCETDNMVHLDAPEISEQDQKMLEEESNAIVAEIKSRKKSRQKQEQAPVVAVHANKEEGNTSTKNLSIAEKQCGRSNMPSLKAKAELSKKDKCDVKTGPSPMMYNEIKMNTVNQELLNKSIDGIERFNRVLSSRESFNSIEDANSEQENCSSQAVKKKEVDVPPSFVITSPSKSRGRQKLYPRLNMSLNFEDSHQSSPADSNRGVLEMSSGLEVTNNTNSSNYNFHLPLDDSQEISQSADIIKNKIFDHVGEWDSSQTSGKVLMNNDDRIKSYQFRLLKRRDTGRPVDADIKSSPEKQTVQHSLRKEIVNTKNNDYLSQSFNSDRSGASSSCSLLYNKEMGLICKKCFDTSCCHMDEVNDIEAFSPSNIMKQTVDYESSELRTGEPVADNTRERENDIFREMDQNELKQDSANTLDPVVPVSRIKDTKALESRVRNIDGKNIHLKVLYNSSHEEYPSEHGTLKRERDLAPLLQQDYVNNRDTRSHFPNGLTQNTMTPFDTAQRNYQYSDSRAYDQGGPYYEPLSLPYEPPVQLYNGERFFDEPSVHIRRQPSSKYEPYDLDYQNKLAKIQDNRRNLNHLLIKTTPLSNNFAMNDDVSGRSALLLPFTDISISNEPETPKTSRRSNSIIAASDLETVFEVDERTSSSTPKPTTGKNSSTATSGVAEKIAERNNDEGSRVMLTQGALNDTALTKSGVHQHRIDQNFPSSSPSPEYDEKDQILQLLDQARSILNLKKRKTSKDCFINTDKIYNRNMMKANSALSNGGRMSPEKKPKTASPPALQDESISSGKSIEKAKSAPSVLEGRMRRNEQDSDERSLEKRKDEVKDLDVSLNLDLWVNTAAVSSANEKEEDLKKSSYLSNEISNESDKEHISSRNSTPSPGDSGIELNNSNSNSIAIDSKTDIDTLSKDKKTTGSVRYPEGNNKENSRIYHRNQRNLHSTEDMNTNENKNEDIGQVRRISNRKKDDYTDVYSKRWINRSHIDEGDENENSIHSRHPFVNRLSGGGYRLKENPGSPNRITISHGNNTYENLEQYRQHITNRPNIKGGRYENSGDRFQRSLSYNTITDVDTDDGPDFDLLQRRHSYNRTLSLPNQAYAVDTFSSHSLVSDRIPNHNIDTKKSKWLLSSQKKTVTPNIDRQNDVHDQQYFQRNTGGNPLNKYDNNESYDYLQHRNEMIPKTIPSTYSRNFIKSLPVVPQQTRFSRLNSETLHSKKSYRLSDHIISQVRKEGERKTVERMPSVQVPRHELSEFTQIRFK